VRRSRSPTGRSPKQLALRDREEISRGLAAGYSQRRIATTPRWPQSTVSREVARNGGRDPYRAHDAAAYARATRPKTDKLAVSSALRAAAEGGSTLEWSPERPGIGPATHLSPAGHPGDPGGSADDELGGERRRGLGRDAGLQVLEEQLERLGAEAGEGHGDRGQWR
jgi:hypothetical protein